MGYVTVTCPICYADLSHTFKIIIVNLFDIKMKICYILITKIYYWNYFHSFKSCFINFLYFLILQYFNIGAMCLRCFLKMLYWIHSKNLIISEIFKMFKIFENFKLSKNIKSLRKNNFRNFQNKKKIKNLEKYKSFQKLPDFQKFQKFQHF